MKWGLTIILCLGLSVFATAQNEEVPLPEGRISVIAPTGIDILMSRYRAQNESDPYVLGYQVHVIQSTKSEEVLSKKRIAQAVFPEYPAFYSYVQPYFKLRLGNFTDRLDAYKALKEIKRQFPSAFLARAKVKKN